MKHLRIEDNKGSFSVDGLNWAPIDTIGKDQLLVLIDAALEDGFEMDEFRKENLSNQAHQIIYKSLYEKLSDLQKNRSRFKDESEAFYKSAIDKYTRKDSV